MFVSFVSVKLERYAEGIVLYLIALRILRMSEASNSMTAEHKFSIGRGGHRIDASRNLWTSNLLKVDSVNTDVAWGHGSESLSTSSDVESIFPLVWPRQPASSQRTKTY